MSKAKWGTKSAEEQHKLLEHEDGIYRVYLGDSKQYEKVFKFRWWNPVWLFKMWNIRRKTTKTVNKLLAKFPKPKVKP